MPFVKGNLHQVHYLLLGLAPAKKFVRKDSCAASSASTLTSKISASSSKLSRFWQKRKQQQKRFTIQFIFLAKSIVSNDDEKCNKYFSLILNNSLRKLSLKLFEVAVSFQIIICPNSNIY